MVSFAPRKKKSVPYFVDCMGWGGLEAVRNKGDGKGRHVNLGREGGRKRSTYLISNYGEIKLLLTWPRRLVGTPGALVHAGLPVPHRASSSESISVPLGSWPRQISKPVSR